MKKADVIKYFGNRKKAAEALGISPAAISQWSQLIPEKAANRLARITRGIENNGITLRFALEDYGDGSRESDFILAVRPTKLTAKAHSKVKKKSKKVDDIDSKNSNSTIDPPQPNPIKNRSNFITKKLFAEETGITAGTLRNWQTRHWERGNHYTVIGRTTLLHRERVEQWLSGYFDSG